MQIIVLVFCVMIVSFSAGVQAQQSDISVVIHGEAQQFEVLPVIVEGRTLVPLRHIFETLGAEIQWDGATQSITAFKYDTRIFLQVGNTNAYVNSQLIEIYNG